MARRREQIAAPTADMPRWVRAPLVSDWASPEEIGRDAFDAYWLAWERYRSAFRRWCAQNGRDWRRESDPFPHWPCPWTPEWWAALTADADDRPPRDLVRRMLAEERARYEQRQGTTS